MIDNIRTDSVGQTLGETALPQPDPASIRPQSDSDATVQVDFADILNEVKQPPDADAATVQKARELLASDRLTSIECVRSAARSIVNLGI